MSSQQKQSRSPAKASSPKPSQPVTPETILTTTSRVGQAVQAARAEVKALHPLLELLDPPTSEGEQPDPIEELKALLEKIVLGQRHQQDAIQDLTSHVIALREGRRLGKPSAGVQQ